MPRRQRVVVPGLPHHVTQRGNRRTNAFLDAEDRRIFLRMLRDVSGQHHLLHYSYCLMTNHLHLISVPEYTSSLSFTMRDVLGPYASYFNHKYGFTGRLWQGRFYSTVLDEKRFWEALRYAERNPVRAGMVKRAIDYPWSSAAAHCSLRQDPLLAPLPAIPEFVGDWADWIGREDNQQEIRNIRDATKTGYPCGTRTFIDDLEQILGMKLRIRKPGRPKVRTAIRSASDPLRH